MVRLKGRNYLLKNFEEEKKENDILVEMEKLKEQIRELEKMEENKLELLYNERVLKSKKKLEILEDFVNNCFEYDPLSRTNLETIKKKYIDFINSKNEYKNLNMKFSLSSSDIILFDDKFLKRSVKFCKSCNNKYSKYCCEDNDKKNIREETYIVNCKLKEV